MRPSPFVAQFVCLAVFAVTTSARADIYRWDTGDVIPGTEGITPGPGVQLQLWNTQSHNLHYADFSGGLDLSDARLWSSWLDYARFNNASLSRANLFGSILTGANLTSASLASADLTAVTLTNANLTRADLINARLIDSNLTDADVTNATLANADLWRSTMMGANLTGAVVTGTSFRDTTSRGFTKEQLYSTRSYQQKNLQGIALFENDLSGWEFTRQDLTNADLSSSTLTGANLTGAVVTGTNLGLTGTTHEQLYSTQSYQEKNLQAIALFGNNLTAWDFAGQNLADAKFYGSRLDTPFPSDLTNARFARANLTNATLEQTVLNGADLTGAVVASTDFRSTTARGFTKEQLYSTESYEQENLSGIRLGGNDLNEWDFAGQDLTNADLSYSTLTGAHLVGANLANARLASATVINADLTGAVVTGANFSDTTSRGFTGEHLYSTRSYAERNLRGIGLYRNDLSAWDFSGQDLTNAGLGGSILAGTNLTGAVVSGTDFRESQGFSKEQLYATQSYEVKDLRGIVLARNDLTGWDFAGQDLTNANLSYSALSRTILTGSVVTTANFSSTTSRGFTKEQLYSTQSYQQKNLEGINLEGDNLSGWDFSGQNLTNAVFVRGSGGASLNNADLTGADLRGAYAGGALAGAITRNMIEYDGTLNGLRLGDGEALTVRDYDGYADALDPWPQQPIHVHEGMSVSNGGLLQMIFDADPWDSTISFEPGILVTLGGTLELTIADDVATQIGRTFHLFDWTGVEPMGTFAVQSQYSWDTSSLYTTGEVTFTAVPEPATILTASLAAALLAIRRRKMLLAWCCIGAVVCLNGRTALAQDLPSPFQLGPFAVGHRTFDVTYACGRSCTRTIPVDAWYPVEPENATGTLASYTPMLNDPWAFPSEVAYQDVQASVAGPFPLVVFSHGYGGFGAAFSDLNEHLASHGFVVAAPSHVGNTTGEPDVDFAQFLFTRRIDLSRVVDHMLVENDDDDGAFFGRIDPERIGVAGHSYGAGTAVSAAGGASSPDIGSYDDPRLRAVFAISTFVPGDDFGPAEPIYTLSGVLDPIRHGFYAFPSMQTVPRYYTEIDGANHNSYQDFCARSEYALANSAPQAVLNLYDDSNPIFGGTCAETAIANAEGIRLTNMLATSFLKTYLAGEHSYAAYLTGGYAQGEGLPLDVRAVIAGDVDGDTDVDLEDLNLVRNNFGIVDPTRGVPGDTNNDHDVDLEDLNNVRNDFTGGAANAVPEPSAWLLYAWGALVVAWHTARNV